MTGERVEYLRRAAGPLGCGCPRLVLRIDLPDETLKVWHRPGCVAGDPASTVPAPAEPRPPAGTIACPRQRCGNRAYSWGPAGPPQRRCDGPTGCGQVWTPDRAVVTTVAVGAGELEEELPRARAEDKVVARRAIAKAAEALELRPAAGVVAAEELVS